MGWGKEGVGPQGEETASGENDGRRFGPVGLIRRDCVVGVNADRRLQVKITGEVRKWRVTMIVGGA